ncbi:amino acid permease [Burkholderia sp. MS455]|uniref:amino acid permease n=1 Tax=Burkholderia sp. MS455 TaxID=2811788 RepID=UPI0023B8BE27|nr:amino acid permease [Burkholderia sp. MS455]
MIAGAGTAHTPRLQKALGALDLTFLGIGAIVGTGIFVLTGIGAAQAGPALIVSILIAAAACCLTALAYAEFASTIPVAGSIYTYSYATLGELPAWIIGWQLMLEYGLGTSAVSVGWSGYLQSLLAGWGLRLPTLLTAAPGSIPHAFTLLNLPALLIIMIIAALLSIGVRESARVNGLMVALKIAAVLIVIGVGAFHVTPAHWHPFMPHGSSGVVGAAAIMFFAFIGFDAVSSAAEEVKRPGRDLPLGIIGSLFVCAALYIAVAAVATGIVPSQQFAGIAHPVSYALQTVGQFRIASFIDLGAVIGMLTGMFVMSYGQTRIIFAMSRDGLMPRVFSRIHPRFATPYFTTWSVGLFFGLVAALVPLNVLAELINLGTLSAFSMVSIAVLVLRHTHPTLPRAFRCPGTPIVPFLAVASCVFLMANVGRITWIAFTLWLLSGLIIYFSYSRKRSALQCRTETYN